jgi:hypothetical protein
MAVTDELFEMLCTKMRCPSKLTQFFHEEPRVICFGKSIRRSSNPTEFFHAETSVIGVLKYS